MFLLQMPVCPDRVQKENQTKRNDPLLVVVESAVLGGFGQLQHLYADETVRDTHYQEN
jgi:hypothetical protein